eukprot:3082156-Prymnesium_polylepis.1
MGSQATSVCDRSVWRVCSMDSSRRADEGSEAGEINGACARCIGVSLSLRVDRGRCHGWRWYV